MTHQAGEDGQTDESRSHQAHASETAPPGPPPAPPGGGTVLDLVPPIGGVDVGGCLDQGAAQVVFDTHRWGSRREERAARPRWTWVFTEPTEISRAAATSA